MGGGKYQIIPYFRLSQLSGVNLAVGTRNRYYETTTASETWGQAKREIRRRGKFSLPWFSLPPIDSDNSS